MKPEARWSTLHRHVAMTERVFGDRIGALETAKLENRRQSEGYRDDRVSKVPFVPILVQRQARTGLISIDQASVRTKLWKPASTAAETARARKHEGISGQVLPLSGSVAS